MRVLIISHIPTHPCEAGNRVRIYRLAVELQKLNIEVHFAHIQLELGDESSMKSFWGERLHSIPYISPASACKSLPAGLVKRLYRKIKALLGDDPYYNYCIDDWYDFSVDKYLSSLDHLISPEVVIVEYVFFSKALEVFSTSTLKVLDTHDVFAGRYKVYQRMRKNPEWFSTNRLQENRGLKRADVIIAIQDQEKNLFKKRLSSKTILTVSHLVELKRLGFLYPGYNVLFMGSRNLINVNSLQFFLNNVLPIIDINRIPKFKVLIAGDICNVIKFHNISINPEICTLLGVVGSVEIAYQQAHIVINPIQTGTGLKIKNIEALGYAKPLITTSVGAIGLETGIGNAFLVADTPMDFAANILSLFIDKQLYQTVSQNAFNFAKKWNEDNIQRLSQVLVEH